MTLKVITISTVGYLNDSWASCLKMFFVFAQLYQALHIYIVLVGVEVWTAGDLINISSSDAQTLEAFSAYRRDHINPYHNNDNAHLIT